MKAEGTRGVGVGSLSRTLLAQQLQQRTVSLRVLEAGGLGLGAASRVLVRPSRCVCSRRSGSLLSASPHEEAHLRTSANPHHPPPHSPTSRCCYIGAFESGATDTEPTAGGVPIRRAVLSASSGAADDSHVPPCPQ